jgi:hypothetical protein
LRLISNHLQQITYNTLICHRNSTELLQHLLQGPLQSEMPPGKLQRLVQHRPGIPREWRLKLARERGRSAPSFWSAIGRAGVGLAVVATGAFIAFTSMRANSWFGHSVTPDPVAGEVYSHLSVAAEVIACLLPTGIRFYAQDGEWWTALRGWVLMTVALAVVFLAAGGFAVTNLNAGTEARAERQTAEAVLAERKLDTITKSRHAECAKRGPRCRDLEAQEQAAIAALERLQANVKSEADPQAAALGISSARLRVVQAGALVALCLFSGLFISFGAGLIWRRQAASRQKSASERNEAAGTLLLAWRKMPFASRSSRPAANYGVL